MPKILGESLADHRGQVRQRLTDAITQLIPERGYDAITLADIAAAAGVGRTAVYNHFPDKESVLLAMVEDQTEDYLERLRAELDGQHGALAKLATFVRMQLIELAGNHAQMAGLGAVLSEEGRAAIGAHVAPMRELLRGILRQAMADGDIPRQDLDTLVGLVSAATVGRVTRDANGDDITRVVDTAVTFVLRAVGAEEHARG